MHTLPFSVPPVSASEEAPFGRSGEDSGTHTVPARGRRKRGRPATSRAAFPVELHDEETDIFKARGTTLAPATEAGGPPLTDHSSASDLTLEMLQGPGSSASSAVWASPATVPEAEAPPGVESPRPSERSPRAVYVSLNSMSQENTMPLTASEAPGPEPDDFEGMGTSEMAQMPIDPSADFGQEVAAAAAFELRRRTQTKMRYEPRR